MELGLIMDYNKRYDSRLRAKQRVDRLRGFYTHVAAYIFVSIALVVIRVVRDQMESNGFSNVMNDYVLMFIWIGWGIGLLVHIVAIFALPLLFGKNWKERKIRKIMDEEEHINN